MRNVSGLIAVALVAAACGGAGGVTTEPSVGATSGPDQTTGPDQTSAPTNPVGTVDAGDPTVTTGGGTEGPAAPDFTLALGDGGTYTLSEGAKPVYLVFWAEW